MSVTEEQSTASVGRTVNDKRECEVCGKVFDSWYILNYHILLEHCRIEKTSNRCLLILNRQNNWVELVTSSGY